MESLLPRARAGDLTAQSDLVRLYQRRISAYLRTVISDPAEIDDVVQTTFIKMIRRLALLRDAGAFEPWLFTLARNSAFDHLRRWRRRPVTVSDDEVFRDLPEARSTEAVAEIMESFDLAAKRLGPKDREILAVIMHGGNYRAASASAGITVGAVKARLNRMRKVLRAEFAAGGGGTKGVPLPVRNPLAAWAAA